MIKYALGLSLILLLLVSFEYQHVPEKYIIPYPLCDELNPCPYTGEWCIDGRCCRASKFL